MSMDRDINDLFDHILLTENHLTEAGFQEGYTDGCIQGSDEGYRLGYAQGIQLGQELAEIFGRVIALQQQTNHTEKVKRCLQLLRESIEKFPRDNDPAADIIGSMEKIRSQNKKLFILLGQNTKSEDKTETKSLNF